MDGGFTGEVIGQAAPDSGFAKLRIGMSPREVQEIMDRAPDRQHSYESGKRWIPFYFGNDARRMQVLYREEGCLVVAGTVRACRIDPVRAHVSNSPLPESGNLVRDQVASTPCRIQSNQVFEPDPGNG